MGKNSFILVVIVVIFLTGCPSVSASPAAGIVSGVVSNVVSTVSMNLWSLKSTGDTVISSRSMMKFEGGYNVETVFDGSKLGIEPYSVEVSAGGDILVLDSESSNIYKISTPLSRYSRPKLVAGSAEGYTGHVDGKLREARMNHPKGLTVDGRGNVYVADTMNLAIRKISDGGIATIAGGKIGRRGGGHVDGQSQDAKFSNDFDMVYSGSRCSLLVVDRGNQAIREIHLHEDDCSYMYDDNLHLGIAVLAAACLFGYMLALLQHRISVVLSYNSDPRPHVKSMSPAPYQMPPPRSLRPPLIPNEDEYDKQEDGLFSSLGRLIFNLGSTAVRILGRLLSGLRKKPFHHHHRDAWPLQESFVIRREDKKINYGEWNKHMHYQHHQKHNPSTPQTYYENQNCETNEIVFGAVQEEDGRREAMVIKPVDYGDPIYNNENLRSRYNCMSSYPYGY